MDRKYEAGEGKKKRKKRNLRAWDFHKKGTIRRILVKWCCQEALLYRPPAMLAFSSASSLVISLSKTCTSSLTLASLAIRRIRVSIFYQESKQSSVILFLSPFFKSCTIKFKKKKKKFHHHPAIDQVVPLLRVIWGAVLSFNFLSHKPWKRKERVGFGGT